MNDDLFANLLDINALSPTQVIDLQTGQAAIEAFWVAVAADPFPGTPVLKRCILAALCVRDILHEIGRDALIFRTGLEVRRVTNGQDRSITIGDPASPKLAGQWNAHMTVRLGDILLDPTHGQTKRDWNAAPRAAASSFASGGHSVCIKPGLDVQANAFHCFTADDGANYRVTYFKLPVSVDLRTRSNWQKTGDAHPERRRALVKRAAEIFLASQTASASEVAA